MFTKAHAHRQRKYVPFDMLIGSGLDWPCVVSAAVIPTTRKRMALYRECFSLGSHSNEFSCSPQSASPAERHCGFARWIKPTRKCRIPL